MLRVMKFTLAIQLEIKLQLKVMNLIKKRNLFLVLGGSQGANFFNEKLMKVLEKANFSEEIIFQTGRKKLLIL